MGFKANNILVESKDLEVELELLKTDENDIELYRVRIENPKMINVSTVTLTYSIGMSKAFSIWNSSAYFKRALQEDWNWIKFTSRLTEEAPVQSIIGIDGMNVVTFAVLDAKSPMNFMSGFDEKTGNVKLAVELFNLPVAVFSTYETVLRIDKRAIPFYESIKDVSRWWDTVYVRNNVPETAREPMYSIWYNFHQDIDVDKVVSQCLLAKQLGMESVIIDDGWQTDDNNGGYAYCGDWKVAVNKIPDMKKFADRIHKIGMKFLLWFSVPYVGIHSEAYEKFKGKFLYFFDDSGYGALDVRYPDVREYLIAIYENAVKEWGLDGLKLDFIDAFMLKDKEKFDARWDYVSLEDAVEQLLKDIKNRLSRIKSDLCIELRQSYIGPVVTQCGNMLRVLDCAADALKNRVGCIDLRLTSGKTAVHSDMLMWDYKNTPENAALQIINVLYSVPQISVFLDTLPKEQYKMLEYYLSFWKKNKHILLDGELKAENPEANYSLVSAEKDGTIIATAYSKELLRLSKNYDNIVLINGTGKTGLIIKTPVSLAGRKYQITDCMGELYESGVIEEDSGFLEFSVKPAAILKIKEQGLETSTPTTL